MFKLPELPYAYGALAPVISEITMRTHHDKHHGKYVETVNTLLDKAGGQPRGLEDVVRGAVANGETKLANNAGQAWNHGFFWEAMTPAGVAPSGALASAIGAAFGDTDKFQTAFVKQGAEHFGSGWVWLVSRQGALSIITTHDGGTPLIDAGLTPLLVCDVWEHAYYLDHKNDREAYLKAWIAKLANWRFAEAQLGAASGDGSGYHFPAPVAKAA
jgi:Fe-Mn family superoxide dismutase